VAILCLIYVAVNFARASLGSAVAIVVAVVAALLLPASIATYSLAGTMGTLVTGDIYVLQGRNAPKAHQPRVNRALIGCVIAAQ
jgi:hypothetical protein